MNNTNEKESIRYIGFHMLLKSGKVIKYVLEDKENKKTKEEYCNFTERSFRNSEVLMFNLNNNEENALMVKTSEIVAIEIVEENSYRMAWEDVF